MCCDYDFSVTEGGGRSAISPYLHCQRTGRKDRAKAKAEGGQFSATEKIDRRADENDRRDHPPTRRAPEAFARREAGSKCKRGIEQRLAGRDASSRNRDRWRVRTGEMCVSPRSTLVVLKSCGTQRPRGSAGLQRAR